MSQSRKLTVIMFTDIVGYTTMMQKNEANALSIVDRYQKEQEELVQHFNGSILKYYGDGSLLVFNSVLEAVKYALQLQIRLNKTPKVPVRIGIHTGDILYKDKEAYGDGINIAARLQSFAVPGSIIFSGDVYDKIKNHPELKSLYLGKHQFKNILIMIDVYALTNPGIKVPKKSKPKTTNETTHAMPKARSYLTKIKYMLLVIGLTASIALIIYKIENRSMTRVAINTTLPVLVKKVGELNNTEGERNWQIFVELLEIKKYVGSNPDFIRIWDFMTYPLSITTTQIGAEVYAKPYSNPDTAWFYLGKTPLYNYSFPKGLSRLKIEHPGYQTQLDVELYKFNWDHEPDTLFYRLFRPEETPEGMVYVPDRIGDYRTIPGLHAMQQIDEFWIDQFEVTNARYKKFIDSGGYENQSYWIYPFIDGGDTLRFGDAISRFVDNTGYVGPSGWELGDIPKGEEDLPVTGISWYEAAAFAKFENKQLPTLFHSVSLAELHGAPEIVKFGNFETDRLAPIHDFNSLTSYGTYDIPGNVSEWVFNQNFKNRTIVGGNFKEPSYNFHNSLNISPWTRSEIIGFRCIRYANNSVNQVLEKGLDLLERDYSNLAPVSDDIFKLYMDLLEFDPKDLNPVSISKAEIGNSIKEIIEVSIPYEEDRMSIVLFIPKNSEPPYQSVLYFPGLGSHYSNDISNIQINDKIDFFLKSGRAVIWPAYYASNGRGTTGIANVNQWKQAHKYIITDAKVTVAYIEDRMDFDADKIAFYGYSWGGALAPYILAVEDRLNLGIVALFGVSSLTKYRFKELDQVDYLPRVKVPMLMLGGRYDFDNPLRDQQAYYNLLGTPLENKKWMQYESTHDIPRVDLVNESLSWLDKHFGKVKVNG